jgi:radical SAM protein with 4Fe4S-binding SPASM domain
VADVAPQLVSWNLTRACNLACGHCYLDAVQRRCEAPDELTTDEALRVVREIAATAPGAMLVLTGGEPLLRKDLPLLVAAGAERGLMPVIGTNGTLLTDGRARVLRAAGAVGVGISIDSATPEFHDRLRGADGAWFGAWAGVDAAREAGLAVQVQMTLLEDNRGEIEAVADLAEANGALALNLFFLVCTGRGVKQTDMPEPLYEATLRRIAQLQARRPGLMIRARCAPYMRRIVGLHAGQSGGSYASWSSACLAGRTYFRITPQGKVTPCPYIPEAVGDLRRDALQEVWRRHPTLQRLRQELPDGKCGDCDWRYSCGGCRARAAAVAGDVMAEDPKCGYRRPVDALPEPAPGEAPRAPGADWTPEARALLESIPGFVRERVRERVETAAAQQSVATISVEFMRAQRPDAPVHSVLRRPTK